MLCYLTGPSTTEMPIGVKVIYTEISPNGGSEHKIPICK